jgi:hypothetical protein
MAIVIKEASKTPLALGQLAETLASTYLQHNKMQHDYKIAEQDRIWNNKKEQSLLDASNALGSMDASGFVGGEVGMKLAQAGILNGKEVSGYMAGGGDSLPTWQQQQNAMTAMYNEQNRLAAAGQKASPEQEAQWRSLIEVVKPYDYRQDQMGLEGQVQSRGLAGIGQDPIIGSVGSGGEYTAGNVNLGNVANNAQMPEAPSLTGNLPTVTTQEQYNALPIGARYIWNGQPRTKRQ